MNYQVLARKWRPATFQEMVGQEYILRMMQNALEQKRIHHAYLFTGTRGVGKTTIARILAKCLNCETGITATPCGQCNHCKAVDAGNFLDLYEIDAASRTKVEDTRELLDNVLYPPTSGRFKIYLIDEVHMLSNHSFNALLKTLEEPPEHVKFLLATTDPKKLPITILSRCLQFHLKQITADQIAKHLESICGKESIQAETFALTKLAKAAKGSMRDALSLLDQAIAYGNGKVDANDVNAMLGSVAAENLFALLEALASQDNQKAFQISRELTELAPDFQQILEELIHFFHQIAIAQIIPESTTDESLLKLAKQFQPEDVQLYYQILLLGRRDLPYTPSAQQCFEMTILRLLAFKPNLNQTLPQTPIEKPHLIKTTAPAVPKEAKPTATAAPTAVNVQSVEWRELLPKLELTGMAYALAANCTIEGPLEDKVTLLLSESHRPMLNTKLEERIGEALNRYFAKPMQLEIKTTAEEIYTPNKQQKEEDQAHLKKGTQAILQNPKIKELIEMYDATIEVSLAT